MFSFFWLSKKISIYLFTFSIIFSANTQVLLSMSTIESQKEINPSHESENLDSKISRLLSNVAE